MKRGWIFQGWGIRAILEGRKTMTRRIIKPQPTENEDRKIGLIDKRIGDFSEPYRTWLDRTSEGKTSFEYDYNPEYFKCPVCGKSVEIWSDEDVGICDTCDKEIRRSEKEQSCLDWCEYADKCREMIKNVKRE